MQLLLEIAFALGEVAFARRARGFLLRGVEFGVARLQLRLEPRDLAVQGGARAVRCPGPARETPTKAEGFPSATDDAAPTRPGLRLGAVAET